MKDFLKKAFPFLSVAAGAFGGPVGIAGAKILGSVLSKEIKPDEIAVELTTLTTTEEGRAKAKDAEQQFMVAMAQLGYDHVEDLERIAAQDRDSARKREVSVKDKMPLVLAVAVCFMFNMVLATLHFKAVPGESKDILLIMLGALTAGWKDVYGYYFGSSASSARKDEVIARNGNGK